MRAVLLKDFKSDHLVVEDIPMPALRPGHVLIKMAAASINPSDLVFLRNQYGVAKKLPVVPGFEGSGTVVSAAAGWYGRWLVGKRVACKAPEDGNGTWAEYVATEAKCVIPLKREVTLEQGAALVVNPLTAYLLLRMAKDAGHQAFIQTAAASALGRMIERLSRRWGLHSINIVRRREHVELLKKDGAIHVLDTSQEGWPDQLKVLADRFKVGIAFDAVGGILSAQVADALTKGGRVVNYGALGGENCQMSPRSLIFEDKHLDGFWLSAWIKKRHPLRNIRMILECQNMLGAELRTEIQARLPLEKVHEALALYKAKRSVGKVILIPQEELKQ